MTEDSRNWKRYTRRGALGLMGVGAVGVASETLGFTNVTSNRDTFLRINDDDAALVEATGSSSSDGTVGGDPLSGLESTTIDDDLTTTFTNRSTVDLAASTDDLTVYVEGTDDNGGSLSINSTTNFDQNVVSGSTPIQNGDRVEFTNNSTLGTDSSADIELIEDTNTQDNYVTIQVEVQVIFEETQIDFTRSNITIQST